jgi:hypothetical protein
MGIKSSDFLPCASFFAEGRTAAGILALIMQMSLIFWPSAAVWARKVAVRSDVDRVLAHFAETHRVDPYLQPTKKFRRVA